MSESANTTPVQRLDPQVTAEKFGDLVAVMDRLRSPGGCVWDARQSHESLMKYLVEESYEVIEAIEAPGGPTAHRDELVEELGDLLLQVVFHARVAQERTAQDGGFTITDVLEAITTKLVRRHPQVFDAGGPKAGNDDDAWQGRNLTNGGAAESVGTSNAALHARWESIKQQEKPERTGPFDGIPPGLPALQYAEKVLSKARRHGLEAEDSEAPTGVVVPESEAELGRLLYQIVRQASARGLDAERALRTVARSRTEVHGTG